MASSADDFHRQYAKAIAEALQAREEEEKSEINNRNAFDDATSFERAKHTYSELCHDDPILPSDVDCRCLSKALAPRQIGNRKENSRLGLCPRLVDGLLQAVARVESNSSAPQPQSSENNAESFGAIGTASREGYAQLAFAIFMEGPYRCIQQAEDLSVASSFLGSFDPPVADSSSSQLTSEERSRLVDEATQSIVDGIEKMAMEDENRDDQKVSNSEKDDASSSSSSDFFYNKGNQSNQPNDHDSIEEIFAEESDPDDFDFGPDLSQQTVGMGTVNYSEVDCGFDPLRLSKPNTTNQTWDGARKAIYYLISHLSYGKLLLSSLSTRTWLDMSVSDTLADFSFMLLLHQTQEGESGKKESLLVSSTDENTKDNQDISSLWDRPLFLLRDRALDSNRDHDALVPYLQLLQAFLSHSENDIMSILSSPSSKQAFLLPPIASVGLSGLATLCSSKELTSVSASKMSSSSVLSICPREEVKKSILSSLYSLAHILECVRPKTFDNSEEAMEHERLWIRTIACAFPIIEYLTNLRARFDFQHVFDGSGGKNLVFTDADAKSILDSGVLRELLALFTAAGKPDKSGNVSDASSITRAQLLRTIYALCISSPQVLGKYVVRVPDLSREVQSTQFMEDSLIDGIFWASLISSLLETKSDAPAPRLKLRAGVKLKTSSGPVDDPNVAERVCTGFLTLCDTVKMALMNMKESVTQTADEISKEQLEKHTKSLADIICFANCLANNNNAINIWIGSLTNEQTQKARDKIAELRSVLSSIPSYSNDIVAQCTGHKKNDDDEDTESEDTKEDGVLKQKETSLMQKQKEFGKMVASVRASIKIISSALESQKGRGLSLKGDMLCNISSKTD